MYLFKYETEYLVIDEMIIRRKMMRNEKNKNLTYSSDVVRWNVLKLPLKQFESRLIVIITGV